MFNTDSIVYEELGDNEDNSKRYRIKIKNLDKFLQQIYNFFFRKGYYCILIENIVNIFIMTFIICYAITLTSFIDYNILLNKYDLPKDYVSIIIFFSLFFLVVTLLFLFKHVISTFFELNIL